MGRKKTEVTPIVRISNGIINSRFKMNVLDWRIFLWLINQIKYSDSEFQPYKIPVNAFRTNETQNSPGSLMLNIQKACRRLAKETVEVLTEKNGKLEWTLHSVMKTCRYLEGEASVDAYLNDDVKPYLLQLKAHYTTMEFEELFRLKSMYSVRFYMLLAQRKKYGERAIEIEELREILELGDSYPGYKDLKKRVVDIAQKELEDTQMAFEVDTIKKGRTVHAILCRLKKEQQMALQFQEEELLILDPLHEDGKLDTRRPVHTICLESGLDIRQINQLSRYLGTNPQRRKLFYKTNSELKREVKEPFRKIENKAAYYYTEMCSRIGLNSN